MKKYIHKKAWHAFDGWLPLAVGLTILTGMVYISGQFILRTQANDLQNQIVSDVERFLDMGADANMFSNQVPVVIESRSTSAYVVLYDAEASPVAGYGMLHGALPRLPAGVYEHAKKVGDHRFTWQPERGVRQAVVLRYHEGVSPGFILSGRSLVQVEHNIGTLGTLISLAWTFMMLATLFVAGVFVKI